MRFTHVVKASAILCPPHVDRTFHEGEAVREEDFARCPGAWEKVQRSGAVAPLAEWEPEARAAAEATRARNDRAELGLSADAPEETVAVKFAERRAGFGLRQQEAEAAVQRAIEARRALVDLGSATGAAPAEVTVEMTVTAPAPLIAPVVETPGPLPIQERVPAASEARPLPNRPRRRA